MESVELRGKILSSVEKKGWECDWHQQCWLQWEEDTCEIRPFLVVDECLEILEYHWIIGQSLFCSLVRTITRSTVVGLWSCGGCHNWKRRVSQQSNTLAFILNWRPQRTDGFHRTVPSALGTKSFDCTVNREQIKALVYRVKRCITTTFQSQNKIIQLAPSNHRIQHKPLIEIIQGCCRSKKPKDLWKCHEHLFGGGGASITSRLRLRQWKKGEIIRKGDKISLSLFKIYRCLARVPLLDMCDMEGVDEPC